MTVIMSAAQMNAFIEEQFRQLVGDYFVDSIDENELTVRMRVSDKFLRPGGTVAGPAMFGLADLTAYFLTLSRIGPRALAVTTNASLDFMRKPSAGADLIGKGRLLKLGKLLSVSDVMIYSIGTDAPVARASLTYAIPPQGVEIPASPQD